VIAPCFATLSLVLLQDPSTDAATLELSLRDCVYVVLRRNLDLQIVDVGNQSTATSIDSAHGAFDPELFVSALGSEEEVPTASSFIAPSNQRLTSRAGLRGLGQTGLSYDLSYDFGYQRQSPSNPFFGLNPTYSSVVTLNLAQPLLRGGGTEVNTAEMTRGRFLVERGNFDKYFQVQQTTFAAVEAYWNYVFTLRNLDTAKEALEVARELVHNNERKLEAGVMTRLDVTQAKAEEKRRDEALITAQNEVGRAEDALRLLLYPGDGLQGWQQRIVPTTEPRIEELELKPEQEMVDTAFARRSDLKAVEADLGIADLDIMVAENTTRPQLDLSGSYGLAGLSGKTATERHSNGNHWEESLESIRASEFESWSVGLDFSYPIGNETARAGLRRAEWEKERARLVWLKLRTQIVQELRGALRDVTDGRASVEAARQSRILAEDQFEAQKIRLDNQHATTFEVREAQRDLFEARDSETQAVVNYMMSIANLFLAQGILAEQFGEIFEDETREEGALWTPSVEE